MVSNKNNAWYLVLRGGEYFAERIYSHPYSEIKQKQLFRDFNNDIMSLGSDEEWATTWINYKNEIDNY